MKWRRGLFLAGIHFLLGTSLITWELVPRYSMEKMRSQYPQLSVRLAAYQEDGQTVVFVPICENWRSLSWQEKVLESSELPAAAVSGWFSNCPARWTTAGLIGIDLRHHSRAQISASSAAFALLIALQWLAVGSFPLIQPRKWWWEPGACNTACTVLVVLLLTIGSLAEAMGFGELLVVLGLPAMLILLFILLLWVAWFGLLLWKLIRTFWKMAVAVGASRGRWASPL